MGIPGIVICEDTSHWTPVSASAAGVDRWTAKVKKVAHAARWIADASGRILAVLEADLHAEHGGEAIDVHHRLFSTEADRARAGSPPEPRPPPVRASDRRAALARAAAHGASLGLAVHAGHGLTLANVGAVARIPEIEELSIGHSIVSRAVFVGIGEAVREMRRAINAARDAGPRSS